MNNIYITIRRRYHGCVCRRVQPYEGIWKHVTNIDTRIHMITVSEIHWPQGVEEDRDRQTGRSE